MPDSDEAAFSIAIILHDFAAGGTERIAIRLANSWASAGRRVTILCGAKTGPALVLVDPNVQISTMAPAIPRGWGSRRKLGRALARSITCGQYDIVIAPGNFHLPVVHALIASVGDRRPPIVCKLSNPLLRPDRSRAEQALFGIAIRRATRGVNGLVAMSEALRKEASAVLPHRGITVLPEPILDEENAVAERSLATGVRTIICAGRMVPQKNFALALRAYARLDDLRTRLILFGDGPERNDLERLARSLRIDKRVEFAGHVAALGPHFAGADLFLLTSHYEGYPAVLIEALAAGVPVVTTLSSPSIREILKHPSFGEIQSADPDDLAASLRRVLEGPGPDRNALSALTAPHRLGPAAARWLQWLDQMTGARNS